MTSKVMKRSDATILIVLGFLTAAIIIGSIMGRIPFRADTFIGQFLTVVGGLMISFVFLFYGIQGWKNK